MNLNELYYIFRINTREKMDSINLTSTFFKLKVLLLFSFLPEFHEVSDKDANKETEHPGK